MKQTFWVYKEQGAGVFFESKIMAENSNYSLLGTCELDITPVKKEVVKKTDNLLIGNTREGLQIIGIIPMGAYEPVLTYKIKE
jgi:hypothetical protein